MQFQRPQHQIIARLLRAMDAGLFLGARCWFGGGTAIVMTHGEYRLSLDVDFLCADRDGYRELRNLAVEKGVQAFFSEAIEPLRDLRADQYGIRTAFSFQGQPIKFEIVREARIELDGILHPDLKAPMLTTPHMAAEKLLANADRCQDPSVGYRDAIDLSMLLDAEGHLPEGAYALASAAYGEDIDRKLRWAVDRLSQEEELKKAAERLDMDRTVAFRSVKRLQTALTALDQNMGKAN